MNLEEVLMTIKKELDCKTEFDADLEKNIEVSVMRNKATDKLFSATNALDTAFSRFVAKPTKGTHMVYHECMDDMVDALEYHTGVAHYMAKLEKDKFSN